MNRCPITYELCDDKIEFSPAYDFLNTSIVLKGDIEETALRLKGKSRNLTKEILINYLGRERLSLNSKIINNISIMVFYPLFLLLSRALQ